MLEKALALEGGSLRCMFSAGAVDVMMEQGLLFDGVFGVSAGALTGINYVSRQVGRTARINLEYVNDKRYMGMGNLLRRNNRAYFGLDFVFGEIPNKLIPFDYDTFDAYPGAVEAAVTNLETGRAEYFPVDRSDKKFTILQATCALPFLFPVFHIDGKPCMDGGAADPIPYDRAFSMGCDRLIVVLTRERSFRRRPEKLQPLIDRVYGKYPNFCETMRRRAETYNSARGRLFQLERAGRVLLFAPHDTQGFSRTERDVTKIRALWQDGYDAGMARLDEVRSFLAGK